MQSEASLQVRLAKEFSNLPFLLIDRLTFPNLVQASLLASIGASPVVLQQMTVLNRLLFCLPILLKSEIDSHSLMSEFF